MTNIELELLEKARAFAYECLVHTDVISDEIPDYAKVYRYEHSLRVCQNAIMLAEDEIKRGHDVNLLTCALAGMLHDIGKFKNYVIDEPHGLLGGKMARPFLHSLGLKEKQIEDICYAITCHSGHYDIYPYEEILEAHICEEADDLDRFGMYRVYCQISDYEAEEKTFDGKAKRAKRYIEGLEKDLARVNCKCALAQEMLTEEIKLQIKAFRGYMEQMAKTKETF